MKNKLSFYDNKMVIKPWGYEYTLFRIAKKIAITFVCIKYKKKTSLHCHPSKKTAFVILKGKARVQYGLYKSNNKIYNPLSRLVMREGLFHSLEACSKDGVCALEFEKPADKSDLIRFKDNYGRQVKEYEGKKFTQKLNSNFFKLKMPKKNSIQSFIFNNIRVSLQFKKNFSKIVKNDNSTSAVLSGRITDSRGKVAIDYGEVVKTNTLKILAKTYFIPKPLLVLHIYKNKKN